MLGVTEPPPGRVRARITAQLRTGGAVLLAAGPWKGADLRFRVTGAVWEGLGRGHGVLRHRLVTVEVSGRGAAGGVPRRAQWWLPGPYGAQPVAGGPLATHGGGGMRVVG
ncbi:hypothetical protein SAMN05216251_13625 [Actinacidiphila alni]|uniref:Uncharacterized protein n=2 Tax=Actinacidiphila alni TaxID=380248 RepID=A0A1I2MHS4_9ACTN|nr:hypothetical protein SAMN05216251_13625 [Actinacidiphila alni]